MRRTGGVGRLTGGRTGEPRGVDCENRRPDYQRNLSSALDTRSERTFALFARRLDFREDAVSEELRTDRFSQHPFDHFFRMPSSSHA